MSVCPSITHTYCIETAKHIITLCTSTTCMIDHHSSFSVPNVMAIFGRCPRNGVECSWIVPRWAMDVAEVIYYIHGQMEDKKPNDFCCIICVTEQWALTVIKLLSFYRQVLRQHVVPINVKFGAGERRISRLSGQKCGNTAPKPVKISNFGNKFTPQERLFAIFFYDILSVYTRL